MGVCAFGASALARLIGNARGVGARPRGDRARVRGAAFIDSGSALIVSAAMAGVGVAVIQALLPGVMKTRFAARPALRDGALLRLDHGGRRARRGLTPGVAALFSWRAGLAVWALPAAAHSRCGRS